MKIDKEFKSLIPSLQPEEYHQLEKSILSEGCRDALVIWKNGDDILIDGHNRYAICQKHKIKFSTYKKEFADKNEAKIWIINNQFGRRNLPAYERAKLALKLEDIFSQKAKEKQKEAGGAVRQKSAQAVINTRNELAKVAGVSHNTIERVKSIESKATAQTKEKLQRGDISINEAYKEIQKEEKKIEIEDAINKIKSEYGKTIIAPIIYNEDYNAFLNRFNKCDLLLTDPPYSTDIENMDEFINGWLFKALNKVKESGAAFVCIGAYPEEVRKYLNAKIPEHLNLKQILIWTYKNTLGINPKDRYKQNYQMILFYTGQKFTTLNCPLTSEQWAVQEINAPGMFGSQDERYYKWQKPDELAERLIRHTTKDGDTILDPFAGSGTFLIAASKLNRTSYGCEIDKSVIKIAIKRGCKNV